jgi:WD40 repeat protein
MSTGEIVYHTAAVGIVFNKESRSQRFFMEHVDDIISMDIHNEKKIFATGEIGPYPLIAVWDAETMQCLSRFTSPLTKGINQLAFSRNGKYLVASAADDEHCIAVFDWSKGGLDTVSDNKFRKARGGVGASGIVATGKGPRSNILHLCFNEKGDTIAAMCVKVYMF